MSTFNGFHLCLVLAFLVVFVAHGDGEGLPPEFTRWHVYVINGLSDGRVLFIHCKSKDDDLGSRNLGPGTNFSWSFRQQVFHRTLFWCYANKNNGSGNDNNRAHATFNVFWQDVILFHKCSWKDCIWIAKDDGIYIKDLTRNTDEFRRKWEPGLLRD